MHRLHIALTTDVPIIQNPTYADDGLISQHVADFMNNSKFIEAYGLGRKTGALNQHPGDIHFRAYTANRHNFTFLIPHPNPPPLGEGVYEKRRLCQFAVYVACWAAKYALALDGDFVECGVGKGLLTRTIVHYLGFESIPKKFYLFDTFTGIPIEDAIDRQEKKNISLLNKTHFAKEYHEEVMRTFIKYPNVVIIRGRIPQSFSTTTLDRVSYISIDMNNAAAEIAAIEYLWIKLVAGGVVVLDDYAYGPEFMTQKKAWDRFAELNNFEILTLPTGQGLIIKQETYDC